jgi:hypothetical protein
MAAVLVAAPSPALSPDPSCVLPGVATQSTLVAAPAPLPTESVPLGLATSPPLAAPENTDKHFKSVAEAAQALILGQRPDNPTTLEDMMIRVPGEKIEINSSTHRNEYARFLRCCNNPQRMPSELVEKFNGGNFNRNDLFQEYFENGDDMAKVLLVHKRLFLSRQRTRTVYGWKTRADRVCARMCLSVFVCMCMCMCV